MRKEQFKGFIKYEFFQNNSIFEFSLELLSISIIFSWVFAENSGNLFYTILGLYVEIDFIWGIFNKEFLIISEGSKKSIGKKVQYINKHNTSIRKYIKNILVESEQQLSLHKKWSFPLRISSVNVTKSSDSCGSGHIYLRNPL